jgi:FixJ family two-component response regulator
MGSKSKIYLIDDDAAVRDALVLFLEIYGYSVHAFESAEEFLCQGKEVNQGVLVLDIRLPGMSGIELQTELRKRKNDIPVIFITGHGDDEIRKSVTQEGIIDFIEKPINHDALLKCIETTLKRVTN